MLRTKSVPLPAPIQVGAVAISEIVLREPPFDTILVFGEPYTMGRTPEGGIVAIDNLDALSAYVDVCLVNVSRDAIQAIGAVKTREVIEAIRGFFQPDPIPSPTDVPADGSTTSPEISSGTAG